MLDIATMFSRPTAAPKTVKMTASTTAVRTARTSSKAAQLPLDVRCGMDSILGRFMSVGKCSIIVAHEGGVREWDASDVVPVIGVASSAVHELLWTALSLHTGNLRTMQLAG